MDERRFDSLARALSEAGTRRGLLGLLATLPLLSGLFALFDAEDEADAKGRRRRRKKRHKHGRPRKHGKKRCRPHAKSKTCAGKCGNVKNNCKKRVNCVSCGTNAICDGSACLSCDVCPTCVYTTVQAAIDAATAGATIAICRGAYVTEATLDKNLTLVGAGMGDDPSTATILDGGLAHGVLTVEVGVTATVRALTVTRGKTAVFGGGIVNHGTLDLKSVTVSENETSGGGGGILNEGLLTMTDCLVTMNDASAGGGGGGIYNSGDPARTTLVRTVVEQNDAGGGAGIQNHVGVVNLTDNSHVRNNDASEAPPSGGGLRNDDGTVSLSGGSTITDNTPDNCIDINGGTGCPA